MNTMPEIRLLEADEIECRVGPINEGGLSLFLYKDARVDQRILDEAFTPYNWKRSHQLIDGNLYCTVEIWDHQKQQWIGKQDVGTMSNEEKEKGQASDSFKRACFNWGIGRELYTSPFIWIPADRVRIEKSQDKRFYTKERFQVKTISYNEKREINGLEIVNGKGITVYKLSGMGQSPVEKAKKELSQQMEDRRTAEGAQAGVFHEPTFPGMASMPPDLKKELDRTGIPLMTVLNRYGLTDLSQVVPEIYSKMMKDLKRSKTKMAA